MPQSGVGLPRFFGEIADPQQARWILHFGFFTTKSLEVDTERPIHAAGDDFQIVLPAPAKLGFFQRFQIRHPIAFANERRGIPVL